MLFSVSVFTDADYSVFTNQIVKEPVLFMLQGSNAADTFIENKKQPQQVGLFWLSRVSNKVNNTVRHRGVNRWSHFFWMDFSIHRKLPVHQELRQASGLSAGGIDFQPVRLFPVCR